MQTKGDISFPKKKNVIFCVRMLLECSDLHLAREWSALCMHNRFAAKLGTGIKQVCLKGTFSHGF